MGGYQIFVCNCVTFVEQCPSLQHKYKTTVDDKTWCNCRKSGNE